MSDINYAAKAHTLAKSLLYMGKPSMQREADAIGDHVTKQAAELSALRARVAELEAALGYIVVNERNFTENMHPVLLPEGKRAFAAARAALKEK